MKACTWSQIAELRHSDYLPRSHSALAVLLRQWNKPKGDLWTPCQPLFYRIQLSSKDPHQLPQIQSLFSERLEWLTLVDQGTTLFPWYFFYSPFHDWITGRMPLVQYHTSMLVRDCHPLITLQQNNMHQVQVLLLSLVVHLLKQRKVASQCCPPKTKWLCFLLNMCFNLNHNGVHLHWDVPQRYPRLHFHICTQVFVKLLLDKHRKARIHSNWEHFL